MISKDRVKALNYKKEMLENPYVVYWMQSSQREEYNHALEYAIDASNKLNKPLIVYFGLTDNYPEANKRHYYFMLQGLREVKQALHNRNIKMIVLKTSSELGAVEMSKYAAILVVDRGYLRLERAWRDYAAKNAECFLVQVETNVVVPIEQASQKEEYAAATIRKKIKSRIPEYALPLDRETINISSMDLKLPFEEFSIEDIEKSVNSLNIDTSVDKVDNFIGGTSRAKELLDDFIKNKLPHYSLLKNEPSEEYTSLMSPYLRFGQISPLYIYLKVDSTNVKDKEDYLEELVVRRELSMNYVYYNEDYDKYSSLPSWAINTLDIHKDDHREYVYNLEQFENAKTHDPYWNAAQIEMVKTGKMHGYMRMYWGKKIIEWSETPQKAFEIAIYLNNKYSLDGRDANAYTGVAWCFGKHDRPWTQRQIFGMVRYMNSKGLERKFDMKKYLEKVKAIF